MDENNKLWIHVFLKRPEHPFCWPCSNLWLLYIGLKKARKKRVSRLKIVRNRTRQLNVLVLLRSVSSAIFARIQKHRARARSDQSAPDFAGSRRHKLAIKASANYLKALARALALETTWSKLSWAIRLLLVPPCMPL